MRQKWARWRLKMQRLSCGFCEKRTAWISCAWDNHREGYWLLACYCLTYAHLQLAVIHNISHAHTHTFLFLPAAKTVTVTSSPQRLFTAFPAAIQKKHCERSALEFGPELCSLQLPVSVLMVLIVLVCWANTHSEAIGTRVRWHAVWDVWK